MKIIITIEDRPGALADVLAFIALKRVNLTHIQSHPVLGRIGVMAFFLELAESNNLDYVFNRLQKTPSLVNDIVRVHNFPGAVETTDALEFMRNLLSGNIIQ